MYNISHEESLLLNFFSGKVYFVFDKEDEASIFLDYISYYDNRFDSSFTHKNEIESIAWKYSNFSHKNQVEWMNDRFYFKKFDMIPVSFSIVKEHVENFVKVKKGYFDFI